MKTRVLVYLLAVAFSLGIAGTARAQFSLGNASDYVLLVESGANSVQFSNSTLNGNLGAGTAFNPNNNNFFQLSSGTINGSVYYQGQNPQITPAVSAQGIPLGVATITGSVMSSATVESALSTINNLNSTLGSESGTVLSLSGGNLTGTINAAEGTLDSGGNEVFTLIPGGNFNISGLTINGNGHAVVINIVNNGNDNVGLTGGVTLIGGLTADQVLFNFVGPGGQLGGNTNGGANGLIAGDFLFPQMTLNISNTVINGRLMGGQWGEDFQYVGGMILNGPAPVPTQASSSSYGSTSSLFHSVNTMTQLTAAEKLALLREKVKYVFVIFQENRSFDHYFGTFPGANGLFETYPGANRSDPSAEPGTDFPSFTSMIQTVTPNGAVSYSTVSPFLVPRAIINQAGNTTTIYSEDMFSVDHSHTGYINDFHSDQATRSVPLNDGYPLDQEGLYYDTDSSGVGATIYSTSTHAAPTSNATLQTKQKGEIVMSHVDCDTIPFMWQYADRFTLFDNMHQTAVGPSTPNAIAMIGAQTGDTQWVLHPNNYDSYSITYGSSTAVSHIQYSVPNLTDTPPFAGSASDNAAVKPPYGPDETSGEGATTIGTPKAGQETLTFASLPLSFMGNQIGSITMSDQHASFDLSDVAADIQTIAVKDPNIPWGWYQQGYGPEPFDGTAFNTDEADYTTAPEHASYIVHHNGPQYFGYLGDNTTEQANMHGLQQFYTDVAAGNLSPTGGVYYIRGGYYNNLGQTPLDPNSAVKTDFAGNDDHGSYSDSQISEASAAATINAIANSPYWSQSAIIITYDESDGFFDHQPEQFRTYGPDGEPETGGPRIPLIVISPFAVTHGVSHVYSEHSSVIRFTEELEGLVPLGQLPDEAAAFTTGASLCGTPPTYSGATPAPTLVLPGAQSTTTTINPFCLPNGSPQTALGPGDVYAGMGDLTEAFDNDRLLGNIPPLPESYVMTPTPAALPHYSATGACANPALNIVPTDYIDGYSSAPFDPTGIQTPVPVIDPPPADFNPRPTVSNGSPYYNTNNNTAVNSLTGTGSPWPK